MPNTAFAPKTVTRAGRRCGAGAAAQPRGQGLEVVFRPDPSVYDGRFANNAWLQELPKSLTKLTWDNAALIVAGTAARLALVSGDVVELKQGGRTLRIPVWLAPGQAPDTLTLHLGYGRTRAGRAGNGTGFNVNPLRTTAALDILTGVELTKTGDSYELASHAGSLVARRAQPRARRRPRSSSQQDPTFAAEAWSISRSPASRCTRDFKYEGYAWGMAIDQNVCTGCNACVVACQAENNVPVVGKAQVLNGREMHWLRIDRYYTGDARQPRHLSPADAVPAVRDGAVRGGLPGGGDRAQRRRPERHGLQPLRRHALLLEQLPVQGAALQLPAVLGLGHAEPQAAAQPRRHRPQPRRDGEVHLLRAAHQPRARRGQARGSPDPRRRGA